MSKGVEFKFYVVTFCFFRNHYDFMSEVCVLASKFVHFKLFFYFVVFI